MSSLARALSQLTERAMTFAILNEGAGKQWDPEVVGLFTNAIPTITSLSAV